MASAPACVRGQGGRSSRTAAVAAGPNCLLEPVTTAAPERLRDGRDIAAVMHGRRQRAGRLLAVHLRERGDTAGARLAVIASGRVGGAVARNRAKRLLREGARAVSWRPGLDVVLVARAACPHSDLTAVRAELAELAARLDATWEPV
jgi:ribonuclease P protein component